MLISNKFFKSSLISFIPLAVAITLICGLIYVSVQQNYRMNADDPQIQLAEDVASELAGGQTPTAFIPTRQLKLENTLATYIMIFDDKGKLIGSSVSLNGKTPVVPPGAFETTKEKGETRFTWEPQKNVRSALVIKSYKGSTSGFVAVGRSLREVEQRAENLLKIVFLGWLVTLGASFLSFLFLQRLK